MSHRISIRRRLRAGAATRLLVAGVFLLPPPAIGEPVRRDHGTAMLPNGVNVPAASDAPTCLPSFRGDLRYFEDPALAPILEAIDAAIAKQREDWSRFVAARSNPANLVADAKGAGGEAFGRASLSLFLVTASSSEVGPYFGVRGQRLRRLSDEALVALIPEAEKHGPWLRALPTTGRGPIAIPDWSGVLDDPDALGRVYETMRLGGKWPDGKTRGLRPWRELAAREPSGEKKDFPGLDLGNLGLFQLTVLRERLLDAFEEESQAAFAALERAPRPDRTPERQIAFPSVQSTEQGFVAAPATFVPVPAMSANDVRERRAFERRWACLGEAGAVLGRSANDFVARYSGQASKVAGGLAPKPELYGVLDRHPRFGLPMAYRRALLGNMRGFDTGAFATELDSLLRENSDEEKFLSAAGRTGFTAPWMLRIVLSGAGSPLADVWTKAKQIAFRNPNAPPPPAVETDQQVSAARDARERRQRERQNAVAHVVDAGRRYGRPLAQAQIDRLNGLSDEEFDLLADVLHAASGLDRSEQKLGILVNDFLRRLQGLPQRGSPTLFAALSFGEGTAPFLRLDPSKLAAFELFPPRRENGRRSDAADEWLDRANLAIVEHFRGILDGELDAYRAAPSTPGTRRFPKRTQLFALFDEGFAARYGESLTDRVCGRPPVAAKCDALPELADYMAVARFLGMAELALEEKAVLYSSADRGRKPTAAQVQEHLLEENDWVSTRLRDLEAWESRCGAAGDRCARESFGRERESLFRELYLDAEANHRALDERIADHSSRPSSAPEHRERLEALDGQRQALNARLRSLETHVFGHHTADDHARSEIGFDWPGFLDGRGGETGATLTFRCCPKGHLRTMAGIPSKYVGNQAALVNWILEKSIDELIEKAGLSGRRRSIRNGSVAWSTIEAELRRAAGAKPRAAGGWDVGTDPGIVDRMRMHVAYFMLKRQFAELDEDESKSGFVNSMKFLEHYFGNAAVIRVAYENAPEEVADLASQLQNLEGDGKQAEIDALVTKLRTGTPADRSNFRKLLVYFQPVSRTSPVRASLFAATRPPHVARAIREMPALAEVWENLPVEAQREEHARAFVGLVRGDEPSQSIHARLKPIADVETRRRREMAGTEPAEPSEAPPTPRRNSEEPLKIHGKFVKAVIERFVDPFVKAPGATERERLRGTFTPPFEIIEDFFARHGDARSATQSLEQARAYFLWELLKARKLRDGSPLPLAGELAPDLAPLHDPRNPERMRQLVAALEAVVLLIDRKIEMRGGGPSNGNLASIPPEVVLDDAVNHLERAWSRLLASRRAGDPRLDPRNAQWREHSETWAFFRNQLENHGQSRFRYNDESPHSARLVDGKRVSADTTLQGLDDCEMFLVIHDDSSGRPPRYRDSMSSYRGGGVSFGGLSLRSRNAMEALPPALRKALSVWCRIDWQPVDGVPEFTYNRATDRRDAIPPEIARLIADVIVNPYPPSKIVRLLVTNETLRNAYFDKVEMYLSDYERTLGFNCKDMPREKERALRRLSKTLAGQELGTGPWQQPVQGRRVGRFRDVFHYAPLMSREQRDAFRRWANEELLALATRDEIASLNAPGGMERLALQELRRIDVTDLTDYQKTDCRWKLDPLKHYLALMVVALDEFGDGATGELAADEVRLEAVKGGVLRFAPIHVVGLHREELRALGAPPPTPAPVRDFREMVREVQALERRAEAEIKKLRPGDPAIESWRNLGYHAFLLRDAFLTFRPSDFGPLSDSAKQYVLQELPKAWTMFDSAQVLNKPFPPGTALELRELFHEAHQIVGLSVPTAPAPPRAPSAGSQAAPPAPPLLTGTDRRRTVTPEAKRQLDAILEALGYPAGNSGVLKRLEGKRFDALTPDERRQILAELDRLKAQLDDRKLHEGLGDSWLVASDLQVYLLMLRAAVANEAVTVADGRRATRYLALAGVAQEARVGGVAHDGPMTVQDLLLAPRDRLPSKEVLVKLREALVAAADGLEKDPEIRRALGAYRELDRVDPDGTVGDVVALYRAAIAYIGDDRSGWLTGDNMAGRQAALTEAYRKAALVRTPLDAAIGRLPRYTGDRRPMAERLADARGRLDASMDRHAGPLVASTPVAQGQWTRDDESAWDGYARALGLTDGEKGFLGLLEGVDWSKLGADRRRELRAAFERLDALYPPASRGRLAMIRPSLSRSFEEFRAEFRAALADGAVVREPASLALLRANLARDHASMLADRARRGPLLAPAPPEPAGPPAPVVAFDPAKGTAPKALREQLDQIQTHLHSMGRSLTANQRLAILGRDREVNALLLDLYEPMVHALPAQGIRGTADLWARLAQAGGPRDLQDARRTLAPALDRVERQRAFDPLAARNTVRRRLREARTVDGIAVDELRKLAEQRFHEQLLPERLRAVFSDATTSPDALAAAFEGLKMFRDRALVELSATIERELREEVAREVVGAYRSKLVADAVRAGKPSPQADDEANTTIDVLMEALLLTGDERPMPEQDVNGTEYTEEVRTLWRNKVALAKRHQPFLNEVRKALGLDPNSVYRDGFARQLDRSIQVLTVEAAKGVQDDSLGDHRFLKSDAVPKFQRAYDAARNEGLSPHDAYERARASVQSDPLFASRRDGLADALGATEDARHERWTGAGGLSARRSVVAAVTEGGGASSTPLVRWCEANASKHWDTWREAQARATRAVRSGEAANEWTAFQDRARANGDRLLARQAEIQRKVGELGQETTRVRRTLEHLAELQRRSEWNQKSITPPREREKVLDLERRMKIQLPVLEAELRSEVAALERQSALIVRNHQELAAERQRLVARLGAAALQASTELGSREQRIRNFAEERFREERPPDAATADRRARALDRYFELRQRAEDIGNALAESGKPFAPDDPRVVALANAAAQDSGGCPVDVERVRTLVRAAHETSAKKLAERKQALDALAQWGIRWDGATLDFSDFRVPPGRDIDGVTLKKLFDDAAALLPLEGGSPVEAAMARLLQPSPWQAFEAELQARWARIGRRRMFEFTKTPGADDGAAVLVEMVDGKPKYTFRNLVAVRQEASRIANDIRALAKANPDKMLALQEESNHTLWFLYDPESKRKDLRDNVQLIRQKMAALEGYGAIAAQVSEDGRGSVALPAATVAFHTALDLKHGTYNSIERLAVELNEDWWWRAAAVGTAVAVIAAAVLTAGMSLPATAAAMLGAAATGAGVGLAANIVETDVLPLFGFKSQGSWSDRGPEMLKTIGVFALGSGLGQAFEAGAVASTTAGRTLMSADALAAGSVSRIGVARLSTSPIFAHMRGMAYSSMLIDLSLAAKDAADGYEYSLGDAGRSALHAAQTAFYVWGPDQRFAALARNYWARIGMSYSANAAFSFMTNTWHYGDSVAKARADLRRIEERKRSEGKDPESDEEVLEMRKQVNKLASWDEYWSTMLRSQLTEAAGNLWFARMAAKTAGQINLQRDLARLSDPNLTRETFDALADRAIVEGRPDILDRLNPRSPHNQGRRERPNETPLEALANRRRQEVDALLDAAARNPGGPEVARVQALADAVSGGDVGAFRKQWQDYRRMEREQSIAGLMTQMPQWQVHQLVQSKSPDAIRAVEVLAAQYGMTPARFRLAWQARTASPDFRRVAPLGGPEIAGPQLLTGRDPVIPRRSLTHGEQQRQGAALLAAAEKSIDAELSRGPQWSRRDALMGELLRIRPDRVREYRFDLLRNYMNGGRAVAVGEGALEALNLAAPVLGVASPDALAAFLTSARMPSRFKWNDLAQKVSDASGTNPARQVEMLDRREITAEDVGRCFGPEAYRDAVRRLYAHRRVGTEADFEAFFDGLVRSGQPLLRYMNGRSR